MTGTGAGKGAKYNGSDILILEISLEWITILLKVQTVMTVLRLRRQVKISYRHGYLHLYYQLIYPQHLLSEMKRGIYKMALHTPCNSPTE